MPSQNHTLEHVLDHIADMRNGKFDLRWLHANPTGGDSTRRRTSRRARRPDRRAFGYAVTAA